MYWLLVDELLKLLGFSCITWITAVR